MKSSGTTMEPGGRSLFRDPVELTPTTSRMPRALKAARFAWCWMRCGRTYSPGSWPWRAMWAISRDTQTVTRPNSLTTCSFRSPRKALVPCRTVPEMMPMGAMGFSFFLVPDAWCPTPVLS